jgi:hypothetical protein
LRPTTSFVSSGSDRSRRDALGATLAYAALALVFTWPLARGLTTDVPGDFGDPLLNAWIIAWDASHLGRGWWNANIFHPHPLALAYSEHLLPQALQVLPIERASGNPILSYNLLFLSTFVLSGLGMFLFARELTRSPSAAFVAGVAFAFAPYRVTSIPHLQVLSSEWLPFVLFGFRRYFATAGPHRELAPPGESGRPPRAPRAGGTPWPLVGAVAAWITQNLSCGYYFLFFSPVVAGYVAWEITTRSLWRDRRVLGQVVAACAATLVVTGLFLIPYVELRRLGFRPRSLEETTKFSADVYAYATADANLRLWGSRLRAWPKAEGALFPGFTIVALAAVALLTTTRGQAAAPATARPTERALTVAGWASATLLIAMLLGWTVRLPGLRVASFPRALGITAAVFSLALVGSAPLRRTTRAWLATAPGVFLLFTLFGVVMSWGPSIQSKGRTIASSSLYSLFYALVPGYDAVRAPARFAMLVMCTLALLAGLGVAALQRTRRGRLVAAATTVAILVESAAIPLPIDQNPVDYRTRGLAPLPASVAMAPPVYDFVSTLPPSAVLVELPLGEPAFDVRYMFYSTRHWRALVNGYSGGAPASYEDLDFALQEALTRPDRAWQAVRETGASHAIVHERLYAGDRGPRMSAWLQDQGAIEIKAFDGDRIFRIR